YELPGFFYLILKMPGNNSSVRSEYLLITTPLTLLCLPCCVVTYFIFTYPAVPFSRFLLTTYPAVPLLILFSLTLLCPFPAFRYRLPCRAPTYFIFTYPAVPF